jgi:hypothetical protein
MERNEFAQANAVNCLFIDIVLQCLRVMCLISRLNYNCIDYYCIDLKVIMYWPKTYLC